MKTMKHSVKCLIAVFVMAMAFCVTGITAEAATVQNLKQTDAGEKSVTVEWTGVAGAKYYGYQAATDAGFRNIVSKSYVTSKSQNAFISSLGLGGTYYVRVGNGTTYSNCFANWSSTLEVVTKPADISSVNFITANDTTATINWNQSAGATGYEIKTYSGAIYNTAATAFAVPLTDNDTDRPVHVCAYRTSPSGYVARSWSKSSPYLNKLTTKISKNNFGITTAFYNINVFYFGAIGYGSGFEVQGQTTGGKKYTFSGAASSISATSVRDIRITSLKKKKMYKYRVRAFLTNSAGQKIYGSWSDYKTICNQATVKYRTSGRKIKLTWGKITGASKIKIQISTKKKSGYKTAKTLSGSKTSYTITKYGKSKLKKGKTYYVRVIPQGKVSGKTISSDAYVQGSIKVR